MKGKQEKGKKDEDMKHPYILNVDDKKLETLGYYKSNPGCC